MSPLVDNLLKYDLNVFASTLRLIDDEIQPIPDNLAVRLVNLAEKISRKTVETDHRNTCLLICALLWEHRQDHWLALSSSLIRILNKIGLSPSAQMVDVGYDGDTQIHSPLGSLISELTVNKNIIEHEVTIGEGQTIILSSFQKRMWDLMSGEFPRIGVSAPTSAGKSFVLIAKIIDICYASPSDIFFIVPTITLINQVTKGLRVFSKKHGLEGIRVLQSYEPSVKDREISSVYVMTQERALSALKANDFTEGALDILIVDEVQNIERVSSEGDERSKDLYNLIHILENDIKPKMAVISGPRVKNIDGVASSLFNTDAISLKADLPPVINLTYSFAKNGKSISLNQYYSENDYPQSISISPDKVSKDLFGKVRYDKKIYDHISEILKFLPEKSGTLIFSPTKNQARKTAMNILCNSHVDNKLNSLASYIGETVHENYSLKRCVKSGVAYHHSGVPPHIRNAVEKAFSDKILGVITCTTTLMQGVNLPAKNLIARNPYLSGNRSGPELTPYEFANLRGRAGRLLKDFVGRAIILDEKAFDDSQIELFDYPEKDVGTGYSKKYNENKTELLVALEDNLPVSTDFDQFGDLLSHVRTTLLRYGRNAKARLLKAGIDIPDEILNQARIDLQKLDVDKAICLQFPHWDPLVLNSMYVASRTRNLRPPKTPFDQNFLSSLQNILYFIEEFAPTYMKRYLDGVGNDRYLYKLLKAANSWSRESPLKDVISWKDNMDEDEIEDMLKMILTEVMYSLPKALAPVIAMSDPNSSLLSVMESGIHSPLTRKLTEMGLPREIAIRAGTIMSDSLPGGEEIESLTEVDLRNAVEIISSSFGDWERFQLEDILI
ncbi:DEAD/DEAH box helicase [Oceanobacter antarcticus]|uniref:DEAD/DEAH box helicase n=1 Tax=Oceanobacter antarcticus TaxID=3133425 RepID=A0ABW8NLD2_9GAMM